MNKILKNIMILVALLAVTAACNADDFLNQPQGREIDEVTALLTPSDLTNATIGTYSRFASITFYGRNVPTIIDMLADVAGVGIGHSGHLALFEDYTFIDGSPEINDIWMFGYRVTDAAARVIEAGLRILDELPAAATDDIREVNMALAQNFGMKAFVHFLLVNLYALPYTYAPNSPGIPLIGSSRHLVGVDPVVRATVAETYAHILSDIAQSKAHFEAAGTGGLFPTATAKFFFNHGAAYALAARTHLFMENWAEAVAAATTAKARGNASIVTDSATYVGMWALTSPSAEDIFALNFISGDATSMGSMWRQNGGAMFMKGVDMIAPTDIRRGMLYELKTREGDSAWFTRKYPNANFVNNIPVFRASEMWLIRAEALAQQNQIDAARQALFQVAQRNRAITDYTHLPNNQAALLAFIADERVRELSQEGHRWFDLRRRGDIMSRVPGQTRVMISNFDVRRAVLPIPMVEVSVSGIPQNEIIRPTP